MRRWSQGNQNLVPFDLEIETALRRQGGDVRRKKRGELARAQGDNSVLRDCALPQASGITSSTSFIVSLIVEANNFELSPTLISLLERDQFGGRPSENPNVHLHKFLAKCDIIKLNGVSTDAIRLRLFPFSLRDRASD